MRRTLILAISLALIATACGDDDAGTPSSDPLGLTTVAMPADEASIRAAFDRMPSQVAGVPRAAAGGSDLVVFYGDDSGIVAFPFDDDSADGVPETLTQDLGQFRFEEGAVLEASGLDPDADVVWIVGSFTDANGTVHLAVWGDPAGTWVYNASSSTAATRDAIVEAFLTAAAA